LITFTPAGKESITVCDSVFHTPETNEACDCGHKSNGQQGRAEDKSVRLVRKKLQKGEPRNREHDGGTLVSQQRTFVCEHAPVLSQFIPNPIVCSSLLRLTFIARGILDRCL
jgi:hypothetical protein